MSDKCMKPGCGALRTIGHRAKDYQAATIAERERCAKIAIARADHHREHCEPECKCANGWHIAIEIRNPHSLSSPIPTPDSESPEVLTPRASGAQS